MPELPEVETVMQGLRPVLEGRRIKCVELRRKDLRFAFPKQFANHLEGAKINQLERRSKYILWHIKKPEHTPGVVISHLGMSGRFSLHKIPPEGYEKHDHVVWHLDNGDILVYNDARRFGILDYVDADQLGEHKLIKNLGPEPLGKEFSKTYLTRKIQNKSQAIKVVLMDATLVVGVGNIYASEACFLAGIHPATPAKNIARQGDRVDKLVKAIKKVLKLAIASGGSSLRDFWHVDGASGYFQHQFNVYGRKGKPCRICSAPIQQITQAGRSSFFCPCCQEK